jgi:hypothetical protein
MEIITVQNSDEAEKLPTMKKTRRWPFIIVAVIFTGLTVIVLSLVVREISRQTDRSVKTGPKQHSTKSRGNFAYNRLLNELQSGGDPSKIADQLQKLKYKYSDLIADGVRVFGELKKYAAEDKRNKKREYRDLKKKEMKKFNNILSKLRSFGELDKDSLYLAFVARDLMIYIFRNRHVFLIHIDDIYLSSSEREEMRAFYEDVFTIYDYLKSLVNKAYSENDYYKDPGNLDLLAVGLYSKAIDATKFGLGFSYWFNDDDKIDEIVQQTEDESFKFADQRGYWYRWFREDLKKVREYLFRYKVKKKPPKFVGGYWFG